jgi:hypothetical protein
MLVRCGSSFRVSVDWRLQAFPKFAVTGAAILGKATPRSANQSYPPKRKDQRSSTGAPHLLHHARAMFAPYKRCEGAVVPNYTVAGHAFCAVVHLIPVAEQVAPTKLGTTEQMSKSTSTPGPFRRQRKGSLRDWNSTGSREMIGTCARSSRFTGRLSPFT